MKSSPNIVVSREYRPAPDACARAVEFLLKKSARKEAAEPTQKLDGRDVVKESNGYDATGSIPRGK